MSFNRPSLSDIIERNRADIESRLPGADSRLRHSLLDVFMRSHAGTAASLYGYLDYLARQILPDTADAEHLARWATIWGINRKSSVASTGNAIFEGGDASEIPAGTELSRVDGFLYRTTVSGVIIAGEAQIPVEAKEGGLGGDAAVGDQLTVTSPVAGIQSVATVSAEGLSGGADEEDDESLLRRLLQRIQKPPQGGSKSDYERWALEFPEVTRVWVYPEWMGIGTVGVAFVLDGRADIIPALPDIEAMEAYIDPLRPVTAEVFVFAPTKVDVDIEIEIAPANSQVQSAILDELQDMFVRDSSPGGTIYLSRISEAISVASGEDHHRLISPVEDIVAPAGQMPFLGEVTWT